MISTVQQRRPSIRGSNARALGIATFVVGGLLVFQASDALDPTKLLYMLATIVALVAAGGRVIYERREIRAKPMLTAWLTVSAAFGGLLAVSLPVAVSAGTPLTSWLRDATPYALFAFAPIFAVDGRSLPRRFFATILVVGGTLAAASFAIEWMDLRGILQAPIERLILPTGILASTLIAYCAARAIIDRGAARWVLLGGVILGLFFLTGTRSTLLLVAVPCIVALLAPARRLRALGVAGGGTLVVAFLMPVVFSLVVFGVPETIGQGGEAGPTAVPETTGDPGASPSTSVPHATAQPNPIGARIGSIGATIGNPTSDASFSERIVQTRAAWDTFRSRPVFGSGPGHSIEWVSASRGPMSGFTLDTPLLYLSKFGLVGLVPLGWLLVVCGATLRWNRRRGAQAAFLALAGFATVVVIAGLLNSPFEDKGMSFATLLVLGVTFSRSAGTLADALPAERLAEPFWPALRRSTRPRSLPGA